MPKTLTDELANLTRRWQAKSKLHQNAISDRIDKLYQRRWKELVDSLRPGHTPRPQIFGEQMRRDVRELIREFMRGVAAESWQDSVNVFYRATPKRLLHWLAQRKLTEAVQVGFSVSTPGGDSAPEDLKGLFAPPSLEKIDRLITDPVHGKSWPERLKRWENADELGEVISGGMAKGLSRRKIAKQLQPLVGQSAAAAKRIARTEVHRISVRTQMDSARETFGDTQLGWTYKTAKDGRVRPTHAILDGTTYVLDDPDLPVPPLDPNCRCILRVLMKSFQDMGLPNEIARLFTPKEIASINGPIKPVKNWGQWFNAQPAEDKRDILGDAIYDRLRKKGKVSFSAAVRAWGLRVPKTDTLAQIKRAAHAVALAKKDDQKDADAA